MSYLDKLKPISSTQTPSSVGGSYQQKLKPIQSQPAETRESRIAQGLPVGSGNRVTPTTAGNIVRGIVKPVAKVASSVSALEQAFMGVPSNKIQPLKSKYLGNVERIGEGFDVRKGLTPENIKAVKDSIGTGMELSSFIPVGTGATVMRNIAKQPFKQSLKQSAKVLGKEGVIQGGLGEGGRALQDNANMGEFLKRTAFGSLIGGAVGAGGGVAGNLISRKFTPKPQDFINRQIDKNIRKALSDVTGDLDTLETRSQSAKNALQRLATANDIEIPDINAPIGSGTKKVFNLEKATPNEFITAVVKQDKKIAEIGRQSAEEASKMGRKVNTFQSQKIIADAVNDGRLPRATGERMMKQIQSLQNDPLKIHEWIQNVNKNFKQDMTKSAMTKQIAEDIAKTFRQELDRNVYRKEYGQAFGDNQELKRLLVALAKKANKKADFGDITSDAGLDAAISMLTGNPLYMARTLADSVFKGIVKSVRNQKGFKSLRNAGKLSSDIKDGVKMPTKGLRPQLLLPAPKAGSPRIRIESGKTIPVAPVGSAIETTSATPMAGRYTPLKEPRNNQAGFVNPKILGLGALTTGAIGATQIPRTTSYQRPPELTPITKPVNKNIPENKLGNALMQLESSGGTNRKNADPGEMKWLVGLTNVAIEELKRVKRLPANFDKNNKDHVVKAGIEYFKLMQERNPKLTPGEIYADKYWGETNWKKMPNPEEARQKKIEEFNSLIL